MYTKEMLEIVLRQEQTLQFDKFDETDALALCTLLIDIAKPEPKPVAMQVVLDGFTVFSYYMPGTGAHNLHWMTRKYNTVSRTGGASLRAAMELELSGEAAQEWQLDEKNYAMCGGGFPIVVRGQGMVGVFCVSGLPHLEDHRLLTQALARYLGCETEIITG